MKWAINFFLKKIVGKIFFNVLYQVEVEGKENIPLQGKAILAANHASYLDPMVLYYITPRKFYAVTAKFLFKIWWLSWVLKATDCVPTNGSSHGAVATLNQEKMVLIFPEGGCRCPREEVLNPTPRKGAAVLALKTAAPIIPIAVTGTFKAWPTSKIFPRFFLKLKVHIGPALTCEKYTEEIIPTPLLEKTLQEIMFAIKKLLREEN